MFEPNSHSQWQIGWKPVSTEYSAEIMQLLHAYYGATGILSVELVDEWQQASHNYRIFCEMGGERRSILIRKNILARLSEIEAGNDVMEHLQKCGIPVPLVIPAYDGHRMVNYHGSYWQVFEFITGDHFRGEANELEQAACLLARMHQAFDSYPRKKKVPSIDSVLAPLSNDHWNDAIHLPGYNAFERMVFERRTRIQEEIDRISRAFSTVYLSEAIIHGDVHPQNFLFRCGHLAAVLDFGVMCLADRWYDIAMALHRLVRQYVVHQKKPWQETLKEGIRIFIEAYASVNPLNRQQIDLLPLFAKAHLLRKMAYGYSLYRTGRRDWKEALSQFQKFFAFFDEIDAIQSMLV